MTIFYPDSEPLAKNPTHTLLDSTQRVCVWGTTPVFALHKAVKRTVPLSESEFRAHYLG